MSIHEPHLVTISLGEAGDQILDVAQQGVSGGKCFLRTKPGIILQLHFSVFVSNELKIEIEMLEVSHQFSTRALINLRAQSVEI